MLTRIIIALLLSTAAIQAADARDQSLSVPDIAKIKRICRQAIGYPVASERDLWSGLAPFLRSKSELDHFTVDCSSQHCSGSIRLRDNAEILHTAVHVPPEHSKNGPGDLTPDIEYKGNNRFVGVAFVRHGKIVFRQGDLPQWFVEEHLAGRRPEASNQTIQPTASRRTAPLFITNNRSFQDTLAVISGG